jgi:sigma-B regulation protein RsbU (phosphoserine phosphatase)
MGSLHQLYDSERLKLFPRANPMLMIDLGDNNSLIMKRIELVNTYKGTAIMEYSSSVMEAELKRTRQIIVFITGIGLLIGITGIYILSTYFVRPIGRIVERVRRFTQGDLESQLPLTGAGEFYEISKTLNELIMRIRRDRKNIVEREILQKEMQMAEEIQRALIPSKLPAVHGFDIGTIYKAARMVGGDLFDFVRIDDHSFGVVVADVSGKGIPGSLVMSMVRTVLRLEARENRSACDILVKVNDYISGDIKQGMFVTILLAVIDTKTGKINFASAGHNPIIHYLSKTGKAQLLNAPGMPVGIKSNHKGFAKAMKSAEVTMEENDFLLIYTDGVTEGKGAHEAAYGTDRIIEILQENKDQSAEEMARTIDADIARYIGKEDQSDDITMVILKNCSGPEEDSPSVKSTFSEQLGSTHKSGVDSVTLKPDQGHDSKV